MGFFDNFGKKSKEKAAEREEESVKNSMNSSNPNVYTLAIEDIFAIKTGGCVAVGMVDGGTICTGDKIYVISRGGQVLTAQVGGMEIVGRSAERAPSGSNVGILLPNLEKTQLSPGDVVSNVMPQQRVD